MARVIEMTLDRSSIRQAAFELLRFRIEFPEMLERFRQRVAETIRWTAESGFQSAIVSDVFVGEYPTANDVTVRVEEDGETTVVIAEGSQAVFIEFGAGVYYNGGKGAEGTSPHPLGQQLGFTIGDYGLQNGRKNAWNLPGSTKKQPILTHGTPAAMPMYNGYMEAINTIQDIAREVFR